MTSTGKGSEIFYQKLGFHFTNKYTDEEDTKRDCYGMRALRDDTKKLRKKWLSSNIQIDYYLDEPLPIPDHRDESS